MKRFEVIIQTFEEAVEARAFIGAADTLDRPLIEQYYQETREALRAKLIRLADEVDRLSRKGDAP